VILTMNRIWLLFDTSSMMFTGYVEGHSLPATDDQGAEQ